MGIVSGRKLSAVGLAFSVSLLAACGSSSRSSSHARSGATSANTSAAAVSRSTSFDSPEAKLPAVAPTPVVKHGATFKLGYLNDDGGVGALDTEQAAAGAEAKTLGGRMIAYNVAGSPSTQASDFSTLMAQHVTAIAVQPINPPAMTRLINQANAAGISVIANATPAVPGPRVPGYATDVMEGVDRCAYLNAMTVARAQPKASYALLTTALPVPALVDLMARTKYWATRFGLRYVGSLSSGVDDTPAAGSAAMSSIATKYPNVDAVFAWSDGIAEGAATTQKTRAGGHIKVVGQSGELAAIQQVKQGTMFATCADNYPAIGRQLAISAYDAQMHEHTPLAGEIAVPSHEVTKSNASTVAVDIYH